MHGLSIVLASIAIGLVSVQGYTFFTHIKGKPHARLVGCVTLCFAALAAIALWLLAAGAAVLSPEYGVFLVQGRLAFAASCVFIVGLSLAAGLVLHAARLSKDLPTRLRWLLLAAAVGGVATALKSQDLSAPAIPLLDPRPIRIHCFDLWWPVFLVWITFCFSEWMTTALNIRRRRLRATVFIFLVTGIALEAFQRAHTGFIYAVPKTADWWEYVVLFGVPAVVVLGTRLTLDQLDTFTHGYKRWIGRALEVVGASMGLLGASAWVLGLTSTWLLHPWFLWAVWLFLLAAFCIVVVYRSWRAGTLKIPDFGHKGRADDVVLVIVFAVLAASLADIFHFAKLDPAWDYAALVLGWMALLEVVVGTPLQVLVSDRKLRQILSEEVRFRALMSFVVARARDLGSWAAAVSKAFFKTENVPAAILKLAVAIIVLIAIAEIPNAGKTIVQPFNTLGIDQNGKDKDAGRMISERIVHKLALFERELRPDLLVFTGTKGENMRIAAMAEDTGGFQAVVSSSEVQLPGTSRTVPLGILSAPVQGPMRRLLGVRMVHGTVQIQADDYVVLAASSTGETWPRAASPDIDRVADELAYNIIASDSRLRRAGMTASPAALRSFDVGLMSWKIFEQQYDLVALTDSIYHFRKAIEADPQFALAHYRLGFAFRADGQPYFAATSFRKSIEASPNFVAGYLALADTLYNLQSFIYATPAAVSEVPAEHQAARDEAMRAWLHVIQGLRPESTVADLAAAYSGLCATAGGSPNLADDFVVSNTGGVTVGQLRYNRWTDQQISQFEQTYDPATGRAHLLRSHYTVYLYCKQAAQLYNRLPPRLKADPQVRLGQAIALNNLGNDFHRIQSEQQGNTEESFWRCDTTSDNITSDGKIVPSPFPRHPYVFFALQYQQQALAFLPDDPTLRCNVALDSLALGDRQPMNNLNDIAEAHRELGRNLAESARTEPDPQQSAALHKQALHELDIAIGRQRYDMEALNYYAYDFWSWRLAQPSSQGATAPDFRMAQTAELYARRAADAASRSSSTTTTVQVQSTLGEVLLALGRPDEAIQVLEAAREKAGAEWDHPFYDEARWDLAEAYLCANSIDVQDHVGAQQDRDLMLSQARQLLETIRNNEAARDNRPFTKHPERLDPLRPQNVCRWYPRTVVVKAPELNGVRFELATGKPIYETNPPCEWLGVIADAFSRRGEPLAGYKLHVWGGGVDLLIETGEPRQDVVLPYQSKATHHYYFAQLEDQEGKAVSEVHRLKTFAAPQGGRCGKNLIYMKFALVREGPKLHN